MPEEEPIQGDKWNQSINLFLSALGWQQIGDSNVDIVCSECNQVHGLDSVFIYELGMPQVPQLVFVEAKTRKWKNAYPAEIEDWCETLVKKIQHVPYTPDFKAKFPTIPSNTSFDTGLIAIWVNDEENFDPQQMTQRLKSVKLTEYRKNPKRIFVLSNQRILFLCAVIEKIRSMRGAQIFKDVAFNLPFYGKFRSMTTNTLPLEYIYSKVVFATAQKQYQEKSGAINWHRIDIVFYFGAVDYNSLDFLRLIVFRFQLGTQNKDLYFYFARMKDSARSAIAQFERDLEKEISGDLIIEKLTLPATLPGWVSNAI
jgi:hypothetical protein